MKKETDPIVVCLVSPFPPPYGGMAIQATKLVALLEDAGFVVLAVRTNTEFPARLAFLQKIPLVRTFVNTLLFLGNLHTSTRQSDVVYFLTGFFNFFFWITYPAIILCKMAGIPVILSARGGGAADFFARWKPLLAPVMRRVDLITTPSGFLQKAFIDAFGITPVIVPNIADLEQFRFRHRESLLPRFIVTRSLEEIYNVTCVIRAFQQIRACFPDATLAVVGDGSERQMLERLTTDLGLSSAVTFHGRVPHERIQELYDENDISINASNVDNLPGTVLEAYACGLPIVTTRAGGIPYIVEDGMTGLLVDCNDCDSLAKKAIELLGNPHLAQSLIENGRKECVRYERSQVSSVLVPLLNQIVGVRRDRRLSNDLS